jgi:LysM repeat protein
MSMETVEIALGLNAHVLSGPLASAQSALLAQLKAAGNDLNALSTKAGTSIAFLQISGARIVTHATGPVLVLSIAVDSGNNNAVVGALVNTGVAATVTGIVNVGGKFITSTVPLLRPLGPIVPIVGVSGGVIAGNAAGTAVTSKLNQGAVGTIQVGPFTIGIQANPGLTPPSGTLSFLPPSNLVPFTQLVVNPSTGIPMLVFNSTPNLTYGANVALGPTNYTVQPNETSFTIAAKNGWSESGLIAANPQLGPNFNVRAGQVINGLPPVSVNNSSLTVSTNTNPTAIQGQ